MGSVQEETVAQVYANAMLDLAFEDGVHAEVLSELRGFRDILQQEPMFADFLNTPGISVQDKKDLVTRVFGGQISDHTLHFLQIVIDKRRQVVLPDVIRAFVDGYHDRMGELVVHVESAVPLTGKHKSRLETLLKQKHNKEIILEERVDSRLLGGLVLKVGDRRIDGSLRNRLKAIGGLLQSARFTSEDYYED